MAVSLHQIVQRIEERLQALGMSAAAASVRAGLSKDAIRNMRRAVNSGNRHGVSTNTLTALAPVLDISAAWLLGEAAE